MQRRQHQRAARTSAVIALATGIGMISAAPAQALEAAPAGASVRVVVEGGAAAAAAAVRGLGGTVERELPILDGLAATVPSDALGDLRAVAGVRSVVPDGSLVPLDEDWGDDDTSEDEDATRLGGGTWSAKYDMGSMWTATKTTGAQSVWALRDPNVAGRTLTGAGVGVAVIDTGVSPVAGLDAPGKLVHGPDLSFDSQSADGRYLDGYGHGTHMAGIIAGRDADVAAGSEVAASAAGFVGMAPGATVVNVKTGAFDGAVDVSQVIAGIDWVVTNRASHNIRVLNLSYGTDSAQAYQLDPLAHAVQSAWRAGIVVVVSAGNDGDASGSQPLTMPAADPYVIAVGSADHRGTSSTLDDVVGSWTNEGSSARRPDVLAPGKSVVSLRVPGSVADVQHPEGLVTGDESRRFFRGTGTSQSAAVVSGAVALLLQRNPELTPDQVKGVLKASAAKLYRNTSPVQGSGTLNVLSAVTLLQRYGSVLPALTQNHPASTGLGSLQAARGGTAVYDPETGAPLTGEQDVHGVTWDAVSWAPSSSAGSAWQGGTWRATQWSGDDFTDSVTTDGSWSGRAWSGRAWSGRAWSGRAWSDLAWSGRAWSGRAWSGRAWSDLVWSGRAWSDLAWTGRAWSGRAWSGRAWSGIA